MLQKINRIHRSDEYRTLRATGKFFRTPYFKLVYTISSENGVKIGVIVGNHVGGAVERNLVKRRVRAIFREILPLMHMGINVVIICRPEVMRLSFLLLKKEIVRALQNCCLVIRS